MKLMMSASVCKKNANLSQAPNCNCRTFTHTYETYTSQFLCEFQRGVHSELMDDWGQALAPLCWCRRGVVANLVDCSDEAELGGLLEMKVTINIINVS